MKNWMIEFLEEKSIDFKLPKNLKPVIDRLLINQLNQPIAYGVVNTTAEAIILVNDDMPLITRARALRELMHYAEFGTSKAGISQLHCFVKDEKLAKLLENKFDFIRTKDIVLVKNL